MQGTHGMGGLKQLLAGSAAVVTCLASTVFLTSATAGADPAVPAAGASAADPGGTLRARAVGPIVYTYSIAVRGAVRSRLAGFIEEAAGIYADPRGWSLGGPIHFRRVASGGDFTLWLSAANALPSFSGACSTQYSCTVGRNVIINDDRWAYGSPVLNLSVRQYHPLVINHETGHWLGLGHLQCPGPGQLAPVMQQQSISLGGCVANAWPLPEERAVVARARGVQVVGGPRFSAIAKSGPNGYWLARGDGHVVPLGSAPALGDLGGRRLNQPIVGMAPTPDGHGYWLVAADGGVFSFGDAAYRGSTGNINLNQPVVGMAPTPDGNGYWLVAADGGVFNFGDAGFHGSTGNINLNQPVIGMAPTTDGHGYWLAAFDGGVFSFGAAGFHGSTGNLVLNQPMVAITSTPAGGGYWLSATDGGVFAFGDAGFHGSTGDVILNQPVVAMTSPPDGGGYWLAATDGGVFAFGDAPFEGSGVGR